MKEIGKYITKIPELYGFEFYRGFIVMENYLSMKEEEKEQNEI